LSVLAERAYAKLNLALHVRGRRADGRHDIETIFAFCEDGDELTAEATSHARFELHVSGECASDLGPENLVADAWTDLKRAADLDQGVRFTLDKRLPVASGLGGGSADAAAALRLLTRLWDIDARLAEGVAPGLGADVPACLLSQSCRGEGAGDELEPVDLGIGSMPVLLVNPRLALSTGEVFAAWDRVDRGPLGDWRDGRNDLEAPAIRMVPEIARLLEWLRSQPGATFVRMSGSGATCFALFDDLASRDAAASACPAHWWHLATRLR
jgi:4-diphosphocytidyl-2-C-methyl-D-erythritol kinase